MSSGFSVNELLYPLTKGDVAGHAFHGNQWKTAIGGNNFLARGATEYTKSVGITRPKRDYGKIQVNPKQSLAIANEYASLPSVDQKTLPAYRQFVAETHQQYEYLTKNLGIKVDVTKTDPYKTAQEMMDDIRENHHLSVLSADVTGGHPFVTSKEIEEFRAVHDAFGHAATGRDFDRNGEEAAWASHSSMYSPLARLAMTTATRGQNSAMTQIGGGFPEQKGALLSPQWSDPSTIYYGDNVQKGDVSGHAFHGNQWTGGEGGVQSLVSFKNSFDQCFQNSPYSAFVNHYTLSEMKKEGMKPLLSADGKTGLLIHDHGDGRIEATALFNNGESGAGLKLLKDAIDNHGVNYVECFGPALPLMYGKLGFQVESKSAFDPQYAPDNWNYEKFGTPDYYTMRIPK